MLTAVILQWGLGRGDELQRTSISHGIQKKPSNFIGPYTIYETAFVVKSLLFKTQNNNQIVFNFYFFDPPDVCPYFPMRK